MMLTVLRFSQHRGSLSSTISNTSMNIRAGIESNLRECYISGLGIYLQIATSVNAAEPVLRCKSSAAFQVE